MASFGQNSIGVTTVTTTIWHRGTEVSSVASGGATPKLFPIDLGVEFLRKVSQKPKRLQKNQVDWIYPLVICHIAMERSSHFIANGKPSISMGHRKTMAMLVITRGYIEKNIRFTTFLTWLVYQKPVMATDGMPIHPMGGIQLLTAMDRTEHFVVAQFLNGYRSWRLQRWKPYPLVNCHITMENHNFSWENSL